MKVINKEKVIKCCYCKTELVSTPKDIRTTFFEITKRQLKRLG